MALWKTVTRGTRAFFDGAFPQRQIFFRMRGEVGFVTLAPRWQVTIFLGLATMFGWMSFSTFHYLAFDWMIESSRTDAKTGWSAYLRTDAERKRLVVQRDGYADRIRDLELTLAVLQVSQERVLARVTDRTNEQIDDVSRLIEMTGLDVDRLLQIAANQEDRGEDTDLVDAGLTGQGGPFIAATPAAASVGADPLKARVADLDERMVQWNRLKKIITRLPLVAPLDHYRLTSSFGTRKDPVNNRLASHYGIDMANRMNMPVLSPASGRIAFAGRNGRYGRFVEIDHGFGVRTRYGHLQKILVDKGDIVDFRQNIALLGNSGRSTGPHLHYEVLIDGTPVDPVRFILAGKYLFKGPLVEVAATRDDVATDAEEPAGQD